MTLARRNQSMLYRQLEIINHLEEAERDPDTLAELFTLDHLATRVRRNAESLLVLSGEKPPRIWGRPIPLRDVLRAAIAETEDLERVVVAADELTTVPGHTVTDLTHLMAELTENAVRFSPPDTTVSIRVLPNRQDTGSQVLTVEDDGIGMSPDQLTSFNALLAQPSQVDAAVSSRMGFHVVGRLAARHRITVSLSSTPGSGLTATIVLPPAMFAAPAQDETAPVPLPTSSFPALNPLGPEDPAPAPMRTQIPASALPAARDDRTRSADIASTAVGMPVACRQDKVLGTRPATVNALPSAVDAVPVEPRDGERAADNGVFSPAVPGPDQGDVSLWVPSAVPGASPLAAVAEDAFRHGHGQPAFESVGAVQPVAVGFGGSDMFREHPMPAGAEQRWLGWWAAEVELAAREPTALEPLELGRSELGRSAFEPAVGPAESGPAGVEATMPVAAVDAGGSPEPAQPSRPAPSSFPVVPSPRRTRNHGSAAPPAVGSPGRQRACDPAGRRSGRPGLRSVQAGPAVAPRTGAAGTTPRHGADGPDPDRARLRSGGRADALPGEPAEREPHRGGGAAMGNVSGTGVDRLLADFVDAHDMGSMGYGTAVLAGRVGHGSTPADRADAGLAAR